MNLTCNQERHSGLIIREKHSLHEHMDKHWLVVWNMAAMAFIVHNIWDVILPIAELHHVSRCLLHHQADHDDSWWSMDVGHNPKAAIHHGQWLASLCPICHLRCQWFGSQGCQCEQFSRGLTSLVRSWWLRGAKNPKKVMQLQWLIMGHVDVFRNFNLKSQNHPTFMGRRYALVGHEHHVGNAMLDFRGDVHPRQQEKRSHHACYFWVQSKWTKWESCDISYIPTVKGVSTIVLHSYAIV